MLIFLMLIQNLVSICLLVLKKSSKNQIRTPIKGRNYVANLQKMTHPNLDLVNEKVCTKFGFNLSISIRSREIERKPNCDGMTERKRMTDRVNPV